MPDGLWSRLTARLARWFRRPSAPGRFDSGSKFSFQGWIATAPFVWPARDYLVYVPKGRTAWKRAPLLVLCHGCKQTAEDIAQSTRITEVADREGFIVLLPQQKDSANPWRCWNWFERRAVTGGGEAAIVAAQIRAVRRAYRIDRERVVAAGLSAGGALAAILGVRYPDLVRGVAVHSGLACGAASSPLTALQVMKDGPDRDVAAIAREARTAASSRDLRVPLLVIQGTADPIVAPCNATALVRQYLALNHGGTRAAAAAASSGERGSASPTPHEDASFAAIAAAASGDATLPPPDAERRIEVAGGRTTRMREWRRDGRLVARLIEIDGLGHAWSGGDPSLPYADAAPPAASDFIAGLFADGLSSP